MSAPLQQTKLFIPPARPGLVERPRLLERLDALARPGSRLALVSAPPGSGKTTLLVQWLTRFGWPSGWLSLDARDNAAPRFFAYLIAALRQVAPEAGSEALALLDLPGVKSEEIITLLVNDLAAVPHPFLLALDDFHTLTNPRLHQAVDLLIEAQPPAMRLALLSREDPAMQLARRRARGQLVELRQDDLRFTSAETAAFLNQSMGLGLTPAQIELLEARTEGWAAGLQLAALALQVPLTLQRPAAIDRFLRDFSGSHRFILDYLVEEVLARQPGEVQRFLLDTAILERMCAGLCALLTGRTAPETQKTLEQLARANLFLIPLDEERRWFRYHHLFRDLLLARLQAEDPARAALLERRASDWYESAGDPRQAVEHALRAGDPQHAAALIDRHISERWQTVDLDFHLLLNRLPFEVVAARPSLSLQAAWLGVLFGQNERVRDFVAAAETALADPARLSAPRDAADCAFARTLRALLADLDNQPVALDDALEMAYAAIPEDNPGMRNSVAVVNGTICYMEADFAAAMRYYEAALDLDRRVSGTNAVPIVAMRVTFVLQAQGRLRQAARRLAEAEAYVRRRGSRRFYISGVINLMAGDILLEENRLDEAEAQIREGLRLLEDWPMPQAHGLGLSILARLLVARGQLPAAREALAQAEELRRHNHFHPLFADAVERARLRLLLAGQERAALENWARETEQELRPHLAAEPRFRYEPRLVELARAWLALDRAPQAAALLSRLAEAARQRPGSRVAILALLAAAEPNPEHAVSVLEEALRLAEPEGYLRVFLDVGQPLSRLLELYLHGRPDDAYARQILSAFDRPASAARGLPAQPPDRIEPLSPRELEVLALVGQGLTNQQIAARLVISLRTAKKHVQNIHAKLGVQNRTQAAARARELGLLP